MFCFYLTVFFQIWRFNLNTWPLVVNFRPFTVDFRPFIIDFRPFTFDFQSSPQKNFLSFFPLLKLNLIFILFFSHHHQMVFRHFTLRNRDTRCHSISIDWRRAITENSEHGLSYGEAETLSPLAVRCDDVLLACKPHRSTHFRRALEHVESLPENGKLLGRAVYRFAKALRQLLEWNVSWGKFKFNVKWLIIQRLLSLFLLFLDISRNYMKPIAWCEREENLHNLAGNWCLPLKQQHIFNILLPNLKHFLCIRIMNMKIK